MNAATLVSRLPNKPLVPFDTEGLRTGDCLVRLQYAVRDGIPLYQHITFAAYERLRAKLPKAEKKKKVKLPPSDPILGWDDPRTGLMTPQAGNVFVPMEFWDLCTPYEIFNPNDWIVIPLLETPAVSQGAPSSLQWDSSVNPLDPEIYPLFPQEYYSSLYRPHFIPDINKRTSAKTAKGLRRFKEEMKLLWAERKTLFDKWRKIIPYNDHQSESFGEPETPLHCSRCGCGIFNKKIVCRDCGWDMKGYVDELPPLKEEVRKDEDDNVMEPETIVWTNERGIEVGIEKDLIQGARKGRRKRRKIPLDTMIRLLAVRQDGDRWFYGEGLTQAANMARLLTPEFSGSVNLMTKDIAEETGESVNTIDSRVTRILADQEKYTDRELRKVTPAQVVSLALAYPPIFRDVTGYQGKMMECWGNVEGYPTKELLKFVVERMLGSGLALPRRLRNSMKTRLHGENPSLMGGVGDGMAVHS